MVTALFVIQVLLGIIAAHYAVEGQGLYGLPLIDYLPYAVTRTWHTQLSILWIVTAWLATGLYFAPMLSGHEPKYQRFGVNFLFFSLLLIVVGSFAGEWLARHGFFDDLTINFWFGHQGYEYIDLGRFWQIYLFIGLLLWVVLVLRGLWPALQEKASGSLIFLVILSTISIGLLYGAGLMWGAAYPYQYYGVLAVVGSASLGRRDFRSFCDGDHFYHFCAYGFAESICCHDYDSIAASHGERTRGLVVPRRRRAVVLSES